MQRPEVAADGSSVDRRLEKNQEQQQQQQQKVKKNGKFQNGLGVEFSPDSKSVVQSKGDKGDRSIVRRTLFKLNRRRRNLKSRLNEIFEDFEADGSPAKDSMEAAERQNSIGTFDLFKYASCRERTAICVGVLFMWYAASWQPISVFILAIMASLMGQYSKQMSILEKLANMTLGGISSGTGSGTGSSGNSTASGLIQLDKNDPLNGTTETTSNSLASDTDNEAPISIISRFNTSTPESIALLKSLYKLATPIFDPGLEKQEFDQENIMAAVHDIQEHESNQFLRKSFEINGSAFALALTQLIAFFIGMTLITWAAKKQASRIKILYFKSCLHQEVTWFEAIDSASGSGSSLNALVEKYEDGIGMKLALLTYFIGHVALFALTASYQMFKLAAFCMPFVLVVGLIIAYLSELQAVAIGQHALFAKRSLQLAEEIIAAIRTVFAFNGQQKEITRYSISLQPVYRRSLTKHLYTALNTSLSKFSIFACFSAYCFYAMRLFPPYNEIPVNKATVLAVMRGAEVSIVNILISIPFMEALQQSKGSIARIYAAIERRSKIDPAAPGGSKPNPAKWLPSISFRMVQFGYASRSGPTRRRSTLPFLNLPGSPGSGQQIPSMGGQTHQSEANVAARRQSLIDELADELDAQQHSRSMVASGAGNENANTNSVGANNQVSGHNCSNGVNSTAANRRPSAAIRRMIGNEIEKSNQSKRILNYFNLEIKAGQSVALVGPSGSGKSTVLALVQRLYDITGGQLLIGQHNIKDLNVGWLRNQIGVVTQEPRLFDMSIAENIRLGLSNSQHNENNSKHSNKSASNEGAHGQHDGGGSGGDDDHFKDMDALAMQQVIEAARAAGAHEFICKLPGGYGTRVGSGGVQLSGGQKQRIAIARALIRKPKILLLDESTSALDTESEAQVQAALKAASKGRTTLTVAHRLSTIRHVDLIVVMSRGQVVECGSHDELMSRDRAADGSSGIYRRMCEDQLKAVEAAAAQRGHEPDFRAKYKERRDRQQQTRLQQQLDPTKLEHAGPAGEKANALARIEFEGPIKPRIRIEAEREGESSDEYEQDDFCHDNEDDDHEDDDDDDYDSEKSEDQDENSNALAERPTIWQLWQFVEMPKWSSLATVLVCLLAGLILPMNLIAHSYLFHAFAYNEPAQIGEYLHVFGLLILSFSTFVLIVSFLQIILPGYVGEKLSNHLRIKTMDSLLNKPMFYFDMASNSAGSLCDRFNSYISSIQNLAGTRVATMLEACSTLAAGAFFGFGQNMLLSLFCLSFALLVLLTTIIESRIVQRESSLQQKFDAQLAHLMADALSNIKTIASLNKEKFFIDRFSEIIRQRQVGRGCCVVWLRTFLTSLKFVMPAMSWSASMYYGSHLLVNGRIDLQTIFIVCPVVLFAVNDTFRALVFLPELLKARKSFERLYQLNREFSPQVLQSLTLGQQLEQQNRLHLEQMAAATLASGVAISSYTANESRKASLAPNPTCAANQTLTLRASNENLSLSSITVISENENETDSQAGCGPQSRTGKPKKSISFVEPLRTSSSHRLSVGVNSSSSQLESTITTTSCSQELNGNNGDGGRSQLAAQVNRRLSCISNLPSYMHRKSSRLNSLVPRLQARGRIEFHQVEFAYPNRPTALVLDGFSLSVLPGESVALVGGSGSGKSTCVSILEKFYDYHAGKVILDGNDLRLVESNWVRSQIGLVSQEPTLLSYTIGDNIRYGDNSRFVSMDEVIEAARTANIHDFIMSLPDQYDTELSNSAYSSSQLSGGQRQRIAIARALIRNAPILIFDEATSALDSRNETIVQDALNKARRCRTNLTIAHRLATIRDADKIVVLGEGRVLEIGTHEQLMQPTAIGHYRKLWQRQEGAGGEQLPANQ